jgi:plasmid replication initiation protein
MGTFQYNVPVKDKSKVHLVPVSQPPLPEERLKKSVGAIHSSGKLTLVQRKLANVLMYNAYDDLLKNETHTISLPIMCSMLGWDASNRIEYLKEALKVLQTTLLEFNLKEDGGESWESMTMLSYAKIKNGVCTYRYDKTLAERLYDPAMFAMISLQVQRRIDSAHALNLYENCFRYKDTNQGSTGRWTLDFFREIVGGTAAYYDDFRKLNAKIIKPAIAKINEVSDIVVDVEYERQMRSVVALKFFVREKTEAEKQAMPSALPGMDFSESVDAYRELRETPAFKALRKHGITERLAFTWIKERGEKGVLDLVAYTEKQDAKTQIKSTSGYMVKLVKEGAEFGESGYDKEKIEAVEVKAKVAQTEAQKNRIEELRSEFSSEQTRRALQAISAEEKLRHAQAWSASEEGQGSEGGFDATKGDFRDVVHRAKFRSYLLKTVAKPPNEQAFKAWLKAAKNLDPVKLGLTS